MGCNCKKKFDYINETYGENEKEEKTNFFEKIFVRLSQIFFGILCSVILIVITVPFLIYVIFGLIFGKEITINLNKFLRFFGHKG